ncbi:hypothetical protein GRF59_05805 [Paenibacillus sp. HJL G12]|uniref:DUF4367 domain-containing protein n=1 Tax=Paenibacillus dendrobii TaxID=2691084 RepID=A0A7X3IFU9_9BACL|nr:hypothetical protein [Paenibacillus dendrobii]MWV43139.1 hypothetical protein [Paenibacillus dendrobii]
MNKIALLMILIIVSLILGCSSKPNDWNQATKEVEKYKFGIIPRVTGFEVKEIDLLSDPMGQERDSIIYTFTDQKGMLVKTPEGSKDTATLYGPYTGTDVFRITVSNVDVSYEDEMDEQLINGIEMHYKTINDRILISAKSKDIIYTYEAKVTDEHSEHKHLELLEEAISCSNP